MFLQSGAPEGRFAARAPWYGDCTGRRAPRRGEARVERGVDPCHSTLPGSDRVRRGTCHPPRRARLQRRAAPPDARFAPGSAPLLLVGSGRADRSPRWKIRPRSMGIFTPKVARDLRRCTLDADGDGSRDADADRRGRGGGASAGHRRALRAPGPPGRGWDGHRLPGARPRDRRDRRGEGPPARAPRRARRPRALSSRAQAGAAGDPRQRRAGLRSQRAPGQPNHHHGVRRRRAARDAAGAQGPARAAAGARDRRRGRHRRRRGPRGRRRPSRSQAGQRAPGQGRARPRRRLRGRAGRHGRRGADRRRLHRDPDVHGAGAARGAQLGRSSRRHLLVRRDALRDARR